MKMNALLSGNADVKDALGKFECYKASLKSVEKEIMKRYKVKSAPALLFFSRDGDLIKRVSTSRFSESSLMRVIRLVLKKLKKTSDEEAEKDGKKSTADKKEA